MLGWKSIWVRSRSGECFSLHGVALQGGAGLVLRAAESSGWIISCANGTRYEGKDLGGFLAATTF